MELVPMFVAMCAFASFVSMIDGFCSCKYHHPQTKFCNARFIGKIRVTDGSTVESVENSTAIIAGKAKILTVYKGKYEDFEEGETIYLYTPSSFQKCRREFEMGDQLVTGRPFRGGLFIDQCDFHEMEEFFSLAQFRAIKSHIRTRAYVRGCQDCYIKGQYDGSYIHNNECRTKYEFPVSTSACVPTGVGGRCHWVKMSKGVYKVPGQERPSTITPSLVPSTAKPTTSTRASTTQAASTTKPPSTTTALSRKPIAVRDSVIQSGLERSLETEEEMDVEDTTEDKEEIPISSPKAVVVRKKSHNVLIGTVAYPIVTVRPPKFNIVRYLMKVVWPRRRRR